MKSKTILALDPGLRELGFAVFADRNLATGGVLPLRDLPQPSRLPEARRQLRRWVRTYKPRAIVVEQTYRHSLPWLDDLYRLLGTAVRLAGRRRIRLATYSPQAVRKSLVGNGKATKREVANAIAMKYPFLRIYLTQDRKWKERYWQNMFDAIALGLHDRALHKPPSRGR
jgi:crossover junction endodeoxyribonuclease RuvC